MPARLFNNAMRELGGVPVERPSWDTVATDFPIKTLPWEVYFDPGDATTIISESGSIVRVDNGAPSARALVSIGAAHPGQGASDFPPAGSGYLYFAGTGTDFIESSRIAGKSIDPATLNLEFYQLASYVGTGGATWSGTASAGSSGSRNFDDASGFAQTGSSHNGYTAADLPTAALTSSVTAATLFPDTTKQFTICALVNVRSSADYGVDATVGLFGDQGQQIYAEIFHIGTTEFLYVYVFDIYGTYSYAVADSVTGGWSLNEWHFVKVRCTESGVQIAIDDNTWSSGVYLKSPAVVTGNFLLGEHPTSGARIDAEVLAFFGTRDALSDATLRGTATYLRDRFKEGMGASYNSPKIFGGEGGYSRGFQAWTIARPDNRNAATVATDSRGIWSISEYYAGLGAASVGGVPKIASWVFDGGGSAEHALFLANNDYSVWHMATQRFDVGLQKQTVYLDGSDAAALTDATYPAGSGPYVNAQFLIVGYNAAASPAGFQGGIAFHAVAPSVWSDRRVKDVDAYLVKAKMTSAGALLTRTASDTAALTDAATRTVSFLRKPADTCAATDAVVRSLAFLRKPADTCAATDAATRTATFGRKPADTLSAGDGATRTVAFGRTSADALVATDVAKKSLTFGRTGADTCVATDSIARTRTLGRTGADTCVATDALGDAAVFGRKPADTLTATETAARTASFARSPAADAATTTESASASLVKARVASDTLAAADAASRSTAFLRTGADALAATDARARTATFGRGGADNAVLADSAQAGFVRGRSTADTATALDAGGRGLELSRAAGDAAVLSDALAQQAWYSLAREAGDDAALADALSKEASFGRQRTDVIGVTDGASAVLLRVIDAAASDDVDLADGASASRALARTRGDNAVLAETIARTRSLARARADAAVLADDLARVHTAVRVSDDDVNVGDGVSYDIAGVKVRSLQEDVEILDAIGRVSNATRFLGDAAVLSDAAARTVQRDRARSDVLALTDGAAAVLVVGRSASDDVAIADAHAREVLLARAAGDAVPVADSASHGFELSRSASDVADVASALDARLAVAGILYAYRVEESVRVRDAVSYRFTRLEDGYIMFGPDAPATVVEFDDDGPATSIDIGDDAPATEIKIMAYAEGYDVGDVAEIPFEIRKKRTGELVTPAALTILVRPGQSGTVFGIDMPDARIVLDSVGKFRLRLPCTVAGVWVVQVNSDQPAGEAAAIQPMTFKVRNPLLTL